MNWFILFFALECGYFPSGNIGLYMPQYESGIIEGLPQDVVDLKGSFYIDFSTRATMFDLIFIEGSIKTLSYKKQNKFNFMPNSAYYNIGIGLQYKIFEVGFRHFCAHPIMPWLFLYEPDYNYEGWYQQFYIKVGGQIGGK